MLHLGRCVELLIEHGADVNANDGEGTAPLHVAAWRHGDLRIVGALRAAGASISHTPVAGGLRGKTPLEVARQYHREALYALLEEPQGGSGGSDGRPSGGGNGHTESGKEPEAISPSTPSNLVRLMSVFPTLSPTIIEAVLGESRTIEEAGQTLFELSDTNLVLGAPRASLDQDALDQYALDQDIPAWAEPLKLGKVENSTKVESVTPFSSPPVGTPSEQSVSEDCNSRQSAFSDMAHIFVQNKSDNSAPDMPLCNKLEQQSTPEQSVPPPIFVLD